MHNRILFSHKEVQNLITHSKMNETEDDFIKWNKTDTGRQGIQFPSYLEAEKRWQPECRTVMRKWEESG